MTDETPSNTDLPNDRVDFGKLIERTSQTTTFDKYRLRRDLSRLRQKKLASSELLSQLESWRSQLDKAIELREWRKTNLPSPTLDSGLPIAAHADDLVAAIQKHQAIVVCGETGSGKSTQLPLIAMMAGFGVDGIIGHTQPRRIAARSVAARVASNLKSPVGKSVGYKIRFSDETNSQTFVKLMTDGILLAETQSDRFLNQYSLLIVDEAHERSLNIDFLLGNVKRLLDKRPDLKLIITSATIDTKRFAEHFSGSDGQSAPVFNIEGRTYPVDIQYHPPNTKELAIDSVAVDHVVQKTVEAFQSHSGDLLVFLPTEQDIRLATKKIRGELNRLAVSAEVLPLYARLTNEQQNLIFNPGKERRIVLATNVAESSVTVPRISCVIDSGTARISRYSPRRKVQRLPIEPVSQASANQRAGRCGRIGPGVCYRLFSEEDFLSRSPFTTPEIRRTNLASVILQSKTLKLGPIEEFPFLDPPRDDAIRDGYKTLFEISALDEERRLTSLGRKIGKLPVDPRIGRMLVSAHEESVLAEVLVIASALEIQDPRVRPAEKRDAADAQHEKFLDAKSDFISLLKIWDFFHDLKGSVSRSRLARACAQNFLSHSMMRQWMQLHQQLKQMVGQIGLKPRPYRKLENATEPEKLPTETIGRRKKESASQKSDSRYDAIHRSLMSGLLSGLAMLSDKFEYTGAGGIKFRLWPGSSVFKTKPKWAIVAEIVETTQTYGRTVAAINPAWVEPLAGHLVKYLHFDPHWSTKQQTVMAHEKVSLFGLPIVASRRIAYGKVDPEASRSIFVEQVLAEDNYESDIDCLVHNRLLLEEIKASAQRTRRRDLIIDSRTLYSFYHRKTPEDVFDFASLKRVIKSDPKIAEHLTMTMDGILGSDTEHMAYQDNFPEAISIGNLQLPVSYQFSPGDENDGASIKVPKSAISQIDSSQTPWLIPGLIQTRIEAMIRSLPKSIRRNLVPAPDTARRVSESLVPEGDFYQAVAQQLTKHAEIPIAAAALKDANIEQHLLPNMQLIDDDGTIIAQSRSLAELRSHSGVEHNSEVKIDQKNEEHSAFQKDALKSWEWGELPKKIDVQRGVSTVPAFPAIIDKGDCVDLRLLDSAPSADRATRAGLVRLFALANSRNVKSQVNWLPDFDRLVLNANGLLDTAALKSLLGDLIVRIGMVEGKPICRTCEEFDSRNDSAIQMIGVATQEVAKWLPSMLENFRAAKSATSSIPDRLGFVKSDVSYQMDKMQSDGFLQNTPWRWLKHFPRFYQAISTRIEKVGTVPVDREKEAIEMVGSFWKQFEETSKLHIQQGIHDPELVEFRWMIEEYRVSLFAQKLGTSQSISPQRLEKQFKKIKNAF